MDLIQLIAVLVVAGLLLSLFQLYAPIVQPIKSIIVAVVTVVLCIWLLGAVGLWSGSSLHLRR